MNTARIPVLTGTLCVLTALLAGCTAGSGDGFGDAGKQSSTDPQAVITPVGHVPAADGTLYVRSGAEVVLSAKDSNGVDSAILGMSWSAANTAAQGVKILERGATAMSFRAPVPTGNDPLELRFRLTVSTADGDTGSNEVRVLVDRVPDPDDFLLSDVTTTSDAVNLVVVATSVTGATTFPADVPFTISVQKQVRYQRALDVGANPSTNPAANDPLYCASTDPQKTCVKIGAPLQLAGSWKAGAGVTGTLRIVGTPFTSMGAAYANPRFRLRPPSLNADEVNFAVLTGANPATTNGTGVPSQDSRRNNLLYITDINQADAEYLITLDSADLAATGRRPSLLVFAADGGAATGLAPLAEAAALAGTATASATITEAQALGGTNAAPGVVESRSTALAYYAAIDPTSARDTVDKWLRDNCFQPELAGRPGYYGSDIQSTYLNDRDLGFGREMYFKTDCTTAQRASTGASINTVAGERASIVFNYPSLEAGIKRSGAFLAVAMEYRADAGGGIKYTRFYTFAPDPRTRTWKRVASANFDGRRERYTPGNCTVCHGGKPKASYAGGGDLGATFIPWDPNALLFADTDASIVDTRLRAGFTRSEQLPHIEALNRQGVLPIVERRITETQPTGEALARFNAVRDLFTAWYPAGSAANYNAVPTAWQGGTSNGVASATTYSQVIAENCRMCHMQRITDAGPSGLTTAVAPQFSSFADVDGDNVDETTRLRLRVFEQHLMPASRLTADRFWVVQPGATQSGAQVLAAHLGLTLPAAKPKVLAAAATPPSEVDPGQANATVRLSGLPSRLAARYQWTLERPAGSTAVLVGANTAEPAFRADQSGTYTARLTVFDQSGQSDELDTPLQVIADRKPQLASFTFAPSPEVGDAIAINLLAQGLVFGDGTHTASYTSTIGNGTVGGNFTCNTLGCQLNLTALRTGSVNITLTDADGDAVTATVTVTVTVPNAWAVAGNFDLPCTASNPVWQVNGVVQTGSTACTIDVVNVRAAAVAGLGITDGQFTSLGYTATANIVQSTQRAGRNGTFGSLAVASGVLRYTSPTHFVSYQTSSATVTPDTFIFRIVVNNPGVAGNPEVSRSLDRSVQVTVQPRANWSAVYSSLQTAGCNAGGCHADAPSAQRGWGFSGNSTQTYNELRALSCPRLEDLGTPNCITFGTAAESLGSLLLQKPQGQYRHYYREVSPATPGGYVVGAATEEILRQIRNWIQDGAYPN